MVTDFDDVWDAICEGAFSTYFSLKCQEYTQLLAKTMFMQEHPDAKPYRILKKPNYNDLCLIYEDPASDEWCNQARQDLGCNGVGEILV